MKSKCLVGQTFVLPPQNVAFFSYGVQSFDKNGRYNNAIKRKGAKRIMTIYLGLMALGAAVMALLVTGVCLLCR